jgi:type I restriction enzyme S subunit
MSNDWPMVKLGDVFRRVKDEVIVRDDETYARLTIRMNGNGIVQRDQVPGHEIGTKKQFIARAGQLVLSKIDARNGAFGILPTECDNAIITGNFWAFDADQAQLVPKFFDYLTKTRLFVDFCVRASEGTTNRLYLQEDKFLEQKIKLPPLTEQRRVVTQIEELAAQIHEARTLRHQAIEEAQALVASHRRVTFGEAPNDDWIPLSDYVASIENGKSPATDGRPASFDEWGVLKVGAVSFGVFDERENKALPISYAVPPSLEVKPGDFIMSRANTVELVGACALVRKTRPKLMLSDKTFRFVFREPRRALAEYIEQVLKSPPLREQIERGASGTSPTMKNISKQKVLALRLPPFPISEQRRIVAKLDALQAEVGALKRLQAETAAELEALLPSIFDKAFKGEL